MILFELGSKLKRNKVIQVKASKIIGSLKCDTNSSKIIGPLTCGTNSSKIIDPLKCDTNSNKVKLEFTQLA
jgi:hypothetical protein